MFQFRRFPSYTYLIQYMMYVHTHTDCSIRKSADQFILADPRSLSQLITSLHRLLMPRHSPYALLSLTIFELCLILLIFMLIAGFLPDFNFRYCRSFFLICITFAFHYSIFKFHSLQDLSCWWAQVDSNHRPHAYQACALTT